MSALPHSWTRHFQLVSFYCSQVCSQSSYRRALRTSRSNSHTASSQAVSLATGTIGSHVQFDEPLTHGQSIIIIARCNALVDLVAY